MENKKITRKKLTKDEDNLRYRWFCEFMKKSTDNNRRYTSSTLADLFNESLDSKYVDWSVDSKRVDDYLDNMMSGDYGDYTIKKDIRNAKSKKYIYYYCADPDLEQTTASKEMFLKMAESYIRHGYLSIEDVNTLINNSFNSLQSEVKQQIMSYFGFRKKADFEIKKFIEKVKIKFGYAKPENNDIPQKVERVFRVISEANQNDQQIIFNYKGYNPEKRAYCIKTYDNGVKIIYRYNAYNVIKFGDRYYTVGRDIDEKHEQRVYRVDLMENVDLRGNWFGEKNYNCTIYRPESIEKDTWSIIINLLEMYKGVKYKVRLYVKTSMRDFIIKRLNRKVKVLARCGDYVVIETSVVLNESFLMFLNCYNYACTHVEIKGNRYENNKDGRKMMKQEYVDRIKYFQDILK